MRSITVILCILLLLGCQEKQETYQQVMYTPQNDALGRKMKKMGCECLYEEVKNRFLYNKDTGLYFCGTGFYKEYQSCYDRLSLDEFKQLYGTPHREDEKSLYYYCNVLICGQVFDGVKFNKNENGKINGGRNTVKKLILPDQRYLNPNCKRVDYLDREKMRINQDFFKYFDDDFVNKHYEPADFIRVMPKYRDTTLRERCLETVQYRQYNFVYNKKRMYYMQNYSSNSSALPLTQYSGGDYLQCRLVFNNIELFTEALGQPTYITPDKKNIAYITYDKLTKSAATHQKIVPTSSYTWNEKYKAYITRSRYNLNPTFLPKNKNKCNDGV